jgi:pyridoxal phosphate enzyme (YggS family)
MHHSICENIKQLELEIGNTQLVVVSKYRSIEELNEVYACGHRHFGENRVQELVSKYEEMPKDINWHVIGHLQTNKVKFIAPFVHLIHSIDSLKLLKAVNKEAIKSNRTISFLFQMHIAEEDTKFGLSFSDLEEILNSSDYKELTNVDCKGLMGMASNTKDKSQVKSEFQSLAKFYQNHIVTEDWDTLSIGMSGDYLDAIGCGGTMIRVGSKIFQ